MDFERYRACIYYLRWICALGLLAYAFFLLMQ